MVSRKPLIEVNYVVDSEIAGFNIGEVDYGIYGTLQEYIKNYGQKGKRDVMNTLAFLIGEVAKIEVPENPEDCPQMEVST